MLSVTTDNASDVVKEVDLCRGSFRGKFSAACSDNHCLHIRCFAHDANLTEKDCLKTMHGKIKNICIFIVTICLSVMRKALFETMRQ